MGREAYEVAVTVQIISSTRISSGGQTDTSATLTTATASKHFRKIQRLQSAEGTGAASGPGAQTVIPMFFKFNPPFPDMDEYNPQNYKIVEDVSGQIWPVKYIRKYSRTMQVDVELPS